MAFNQLTALDFTDIKASIKDYLRSSDVFTDYEYEGSALSRLIDILAYNTYYTAFTSNLSVNELFLDSAVLRENVVRLAKLVNYTPRSTKSAVATVNIQVQLPAGEYPDTLTLQSGIAFNGVNENGSFIFSIIDDIATTVNKITGTAVFENVKLYEGSRVTSRFNVNSKSLLKYEIQNPSVDTDTIRVQVYPNPQSDKSVRFNQATDFLGLNSESTVFFVQETSKQYYELIFGDGVFGKKLDDNNVILASYIVCNGEIANGCRDFRNRFIGRIVDSFGNLIASGITIENVEPSFGGAAIENIESIKYNAPRFYQSQYRAVTTKDYEVLVPTLYPNIESITAYGGEDDSPPQFGTVNLVIKPKTGDRLSLAEKQRIKNLLKPYSVAAITPVIKDPSVLLIDINTNVYYNSLLTNRSEDELKLKVLGSIISLNTSRDFNKFGGKFKYSRLVSVIDNSDDSITSNITSIRMRKNVSVVLNQPASYRICFGNLISNDGVVSVRSSGFKILGQTQTFYFEDDTKGNLNIYYFDSNRNKTYFPSNTVKTSYGTVDYNKSEIKVNPITLSATELENTLSFIAVPKSNDLISFRDTFLTIDTNNLTIVMNEDLIASGESTSGIGVIPASNQRL